MIANITSGNSFSGLIMYNEKKVQKGQAERLYSNYFNIERSSKSLINSLEKVADRYRSTLKNRTFHVSLSLAEGDKLSQDKLIEMGSKYMELMGYVNTPFLTYRHHDTGIDHLHIVSTRIDLDGNKVSDSMERFRSQRVARDLELEYGLAVVSSVKQHPNELNKAKSEVKMVDKVNTKHAISLAINHALETDKSTDYEDFVRSLWKRNVLAKLVKVDGDGTNLVTPGIMYSLGCRVTPETKRIKGSAFHQGYTYSKILKKLTTNLIIEQTKPAEGRSETDLKKIITSILNELRSPSISTIEDLDRLFAKSKLEAVYFRNSGGIYGLKIKDLITNEVHKASDIDRGFSWNVIQKLLDGKENNQERTTPNDTEIMPFIVNVSADPGDKPLVWVKSPINKVALANPLNRAMDTLAMRGFVTQEELQTELKKIGFKAMFSRDFSNDSGGITGVAFTELATGNTYSGSSLSPKTLSWAKLSQFVASDHKESNFDNYVSTIFSKWAALPVNGHHEKIENFVVFLNQNGLTLSNYNEVDYISQIDGDVKVPIESVVFKTKNKAWFSFKHPVLTTESINRLYDDGYIHKTLKLVERLMLASIYDNNRVALLRHINAGDRIDLRSVSVLDQGKQGIETYRAITNVQQQIARTLKFALYSNNSLQADQPNATIGTDTFVQSLNKRGVGVCFDLDESNKATNMRFYLKGYPDAVITQSELPNMINEGKFNQLIDLQTSVAYKTVLDASGGYEINYTGKQVELFSGLETDYSYFMHGVDLKLTLLEESYFELDGALEPEFEESYYQSETFIKEAVAFIDALAQVAQGEIPVSWNPIRFKKQDRKRRPGMRY